LYVDAIVYIPPNIRICGIGSVETAAHEAVVPLVVRYLPELPVCEGKLTGAACHVAVVPVEVKMYPEVVDIANLVEVLVPVPTRISPVAVYADASTGAVPAVVEVTRPYASVVTDAG
jgi:hypothetical protein